VHAGELDPGLDGQVGYGTGQPGPQPLGADELPARFGDISPVHGCASLYCAGEDSLHPGPAQRSAYLTGQRLGLAPVTACHGQQRPLAQREREDLMRTDLLRDAGRILQGCVAAIGITGQDPRDP